MVDYVKVYDRAETKLTLEGWINETIKGEGEAGAELESIELSSANWRVDCLLWFSKEDEIPIDDIDWDTVTLIEIIKLYLDNNGSPFKLLEGEMNRESMIEHLKKEANSDG